MKGREGDKESERVRKGESRKEAEVESICLGRQHLLHRSHTVCLCVCVSLSLFIEREGKTRREIERRRVLGMCSWGGGVATDIGAIERRRRLGVWLPYRSGHRVGSHVPPSYS